MGSSATSVRVERLETCARVWRVVAVVWAWFTLTTFALVSIWSGHSLEPSRPIFIGGSALSLVFAIALSWPMKRDVRAHLPRMVMVLRWQLTSGAVIAFTVSSLARDELRMGFYLYGTYLVIGAIFYIALSLIDLALSRRYAAADETKRRTELMAVTDAAAAALIQNLSLLQLIRRKRRPGRQ